MYEDNFFSYHCRSFHPYLSDLTKYGSHIYVLVRRGELKASKFMAKRLLNHPKIVSLSRFSTHRSKGLYIYKYPQTVLWNTVATECQGDGDLLNNLRIKNVKTGEEKDLPVNGLFYAIGMSILTYVATVFGLSENFQDMNLRLLSSAHNQKLIVTATLSLSQGQHRHL